MGQLPEDFVRDQLKQGFTVAFRPDQPVEQRTISAKFLRRLLLECVIQRDVAPVGVAINGARIEGDLACIAFGSPAAPLPALDLTGCELLGRLELTDSCFSSIIFKDCIMRGFKAPYLFVGNGLRADNVWFSSVEPILVDLDGMVSGGDVTLTNIGRVAHWDVRTKKPGELVDAERSIVQGNRIAPRQQQTFCRVRLGNARIEGSLDLSGALLTGTRADKDSEALKLNGIELKGGLELTDSDQHRFEAVGGVSIIGGRIGGQLLCDGASVKSLIGAGGNADGEAMTLDRLSVHQSAHFKLIDGKHPFEAIGEIRLIGAKIGGQLTFVGARLSNPTGDVLSMLRITVGASVLMNSVEADGVIDLLGAKIGGTLSFAGGRLNGRKSGTAVSLVGSEVADGVCLGSVRNPCHVSGTVDAEGAKIGRSLECRGSFRANAVPAALPGAAALNLDNISIGQRLTVALDDDSLGGVLLRGAHVDELDDSGGHGWGIKAACGPLGGHRSGVRLRLDGLSYERLGRWEAPPEPSSNGRMMWTIRRFLGFGVPQDIWWNRSKWLERQYVGTAPGRADFFPQPHEQLAKVLRLMGHDYHARRTMTHKFVHEGLCGADDKIARVFMYLYRIGFGCGYLPIRALVSVLTWWTLGALLTWGALHVNTTDEAIFVRSTTGVDVVRTLSKPDEAPTKSSNGKPYEAVKAREVPCTSEEINPVLYALDTMLPVFQLHMESKCEFSGAHFFWSDAARLAKAVYSLFGWIIVTLAALTWTGVLRREPG
jgi:hypothetical protein